MAKAKKRFGQHFLKNEGLAKDISEAVLAPSGNILEIGPGKGVLTQYLLEKDSQLKVVELDRDMIPILRQRFLQLSPNIIEGDVLKQDFSSFFGQEAYSLVGNFPYNISSQILFKMVEHRERIPELVGMFQHEVARRVISPPGNKDYGVLSVWVQAFYEGEYLFLVDKGNFLPPPKVQSAIIRLTRKKDFHLDCDERTFKRLVKQTFLQRRKMIRNTLKSDLPKDLMEKDPFYQLRPEKLSVNDYVQLTQIVTKYKNKIQ